MLNLSVDNVDEEDKTRTDQFTKMLNLKMHRLSTFRAVGQGFGSKKAGGSAYGGSAAATGGGLDALNQDQIRTRENNEASGGGSEVKGFAEMMFGDESSIGSVHRVGGASSGLGRSFRGSIRSGATGNSGGAASSLRNKLAKGLQDRFRRNTGMQQITDIEEDEDDDAETVLNAIDNLSDQCPSEGMDTNYDMIGLAQGVNKYQMGVKMALTRYNES